MRLNKVSLDEREILKKQWLQTGSIVSFWNDEFSCGSQASIVRYTKSGIGRTKQKDNYGIGKKEHKVSQRHRVDFLRVEINGGC